MSCKLITGQSLQTITKSGWYCGMSIPQLMTQGVEGWFRIFASVQSSGEKSFIFSKNEGEIYTGTMSANGSGFDTFHKLATSADLPVCQVVTLPITNSKHFTLTFQNDVELYSIQNAGVGYIGEISVVGWTKTNARNYEIYLSASFNGNGSFAIIYK